MPAALAFFLIEQLAFSGIILSGFAQALITAAVTIGFTVGTTALLNAAFGPSRPKPSDGQQNIRVSVGSRRRHYGIVHTGGQETFVESANGTLGKVVTLGTGQEGPILEERINDRPVTVVDGTVSEASYHGALHIYRRHGAADQAAIGQLTAKFPQWTSNHRQRGCAHVAIIGDPVKQEHFSEVYNGGIPIYTQIRWTASLYDPRKDSTREAFNAELLAYDPLKDETSAEYAEFWEDHGAPPRGYHRTGDPATWEHRIDDEATWEINDTAALVIADYFAHPDGYGGGYDNVNWEVIAQEADHCDELVSTASGETIKRWRLWGSYGLASDERRQVLTDMLAACDGFVWQDAECKFCLMVGRFEEPDLVITDDHILGMTATMGPNATQRVSAVKMLYTEAAVGYREQESATIAVPGAAEDPNTAPQAVELFFAPHHNQAARVGKILASQMADDRWHLQLLVNLYGLNLLGRRFCRVTSALLGIDVRVKIDGLKLKLAECSVETTLAEVRAADWNFNAATEEGAPPISPDTTPPVVTIEVPTGLALSTEQIVSPAGNGVAIAATWDAASRPDLVFEGQYRPTAGGDWLPMSVQQDDRTARSGVVNSGTEYEVRGRWMTLGGRASAWSASATITPTATVTLGAPTGLAAAGGVGEADVTFRMPTSANLAYARLYHNTANDFGTATQAGADIVGGLGEVIAVTDTGLAAGTEYYWARAFDGTGGQSALAGPATATIT